MIITHLVAKENFVIMATFVIQINQNLRRCVTIIFINYTTAPPRKLELAIYGEEPKVVEGKEFTFECSSTGADPSSVFSYGKL